MAGGIGRLAPWAGLGQVALKGRMRQLRWRCLPEAPGGGSRSGRPPRPVPRKSRRKWYTNNLMPARYLVRLDDACETMDTAKWGMFEKTLKARGIRPLVAVIPHNGDASLSYEEPSGEFWARVKQWQAGGWHVAMHGCNHVYTTRDKGLVPINDFSEFAGVDIAVQRAKIREGLATFLSHEITPSAFVAPWHSFDRGTLTALTLESNIRIISDGFAFFPFGYLDFTWVPQQLWRFRKKRVGVWTICYHPSKMAINEIEKELSLIDKYCEWFRCDLPDIVSSYLGRRKSVVDLALSWSYFGRRFIRKKLLRS
jgi:hypothetical protein